MSIAIYTLTSPLHNEAAVKTVTQEFLGSLNIAYSMKGADYHDYGSSALSLIYVRTGGTEGVFSQLLPQLQRQSSEPFYLLTSGKSNSLAASMEILSFLRQKGLKGEILHGSPEYIRHRIALIAKVGEARRQLRGARLGIVGQPSDWLISSIVDSDRVRERFGIELVPVPMGDLLLEFHALKSVDVQDEVEKFAAHVAPLNAVDAPAIQKSLGDATRLYIALKKIAETNDLQGLTIRCFDLLTAVHNTGCIALARLNSEGYVAGCEGDVPAMLSMMIARSLLGVSGFQANPAHINPQTGEMLFAHCTIPFNMTHRYELDTHFESGIGVGVRGYVNAGPVTIFKASGLLDRYFAAEGILEACQAGGDLCRTQEVIRLAAAADTSYFLTNPIGNHHIILPGHVKELLGEMMK
jgi:L-fucose isomerase-like protein